MISFFRRALSSWLVLGLLALVMIAFIITGVGGPSGMTGGGGGERIAKIGRESLNANEASRRVTMAMNNERRQNPTLDTGAFIAAGGVEQVIDQYISARALDLWARRQGMGVSERLIDGEIAGIQAFAGPTGKFDRETMLQLIGRQGISEMQLRKDIAGDLLRRQIMIPVAGASRAPAGIVLPYASLLLEARSGVIGVVPTQAMPEGPPPTEAEIAAFYKANIARFTIPERRSIRYALFGREQLKGSTTPSEAEIDAFYKANPATYAARETRTIAQAILPDQKAASAFAAKVKAGADFAATAKAAGLAAVITETSREALAANGSPAIAAAAFAAPRGGVSGPTKADLGWYVTRVEAIKAQAGKPLATVRAEIAASLEKQKTDEAIAAMVASIEDAIANGSSFDDVARSEKLAVVTTPALLPNGTAPDQPDFKAPPELGLLLKTAFETSPDDDPTVEVIGNGERHALLAVSQVLPAAPAPLAKIRDAVAGQIRARRQADQAKKLADAIVARVKGGTPIAQAIAQAGVRLPPPQPVNARQMDLARSDRPVPPPLALMFSLRKGDVRVIPAEGNAAFFIVKLDTIIPGDARTQPTLIESTRNEFARVLGEEYAEQFTRAIAKDLGVTRDKAAIERLKKQLGGAAGQ